MIRVNGLEMPIDHDLTASELLVYLQNTLLAETVLCLPCFFTVNKDFINSSRYLTTVIRPGDEVMLVQEIAGG